MSGEALVHDVTSELRVQGYSVVRGSDLAIDPVAREHEARLAQEWATLETDNYLKNGARFRERRYGRFSYVPATQEIRLLEHTPYFQSETANTYAGGIQRVVAPVTRTSVENPLMSALIKFNFSQFPADPDLFGSTWEVACHQFRIIAGPNEVGEPTPEGIHRDEIDFGAIHLMSRTNADGGISQIYSNDRVLTAEFSLNNRMDTLFWADHDVLHSVTPIFPADSATPAVRDILILGYKCVPGLD